MSLELSKAPCSLWPAPALRLLLSWPLSPRQSLSTPGLTAEHWSQSPPAEDPALTCTGPQSWVHTCTCPRSTCLPPLLSDHSSSPRWPAPWGQGLHLVWLALNSGTSKGRGRRTTEAKREANLPKDLAGSGSACWQDGSCPTAPRRCLLAASDRDRWRRQLHQAFLAASLAQGSSASLRWQRERR